MVNRFSRNSLPGERLSMAGTSHSSSQSIPKVCTSADGNFNYVNGKESKLSMVVNNQSLSLGYSLLKAEIAEKGRIEHDPKTDDVRKLRAKYKVSILIALMDSHNQGTVDIAELKQKLLFRPNGVPLPDGDSTTFREALNEVVASLKISV